MRALIIRSPWIERILRGEKSWEIRSKTTNVRERIALIKGGSGTVVGTAVLADCLGPYTFEQLNPHRDKHGVEPEPLREFVEKYHDRAFAWVLTEVHALTEPVPYRHPTGAVIWVTLADSIAGQF